eukprot:scaffold100210_cov38-Phaeocystis_antarctica.AAC.1
MLAAPRLSARAKRGIRQGSGSPISPSPSHSLPGYHPTSRERLADLALAAALVAWLSPHLKGAARRSRPRHPTRCLVITPPQGSGSPISPSPSRLLPGYHPTSRERLADLALAITLGADARAGEDRLGLGLG